MIRMICVGKLKIIKTVVIFLPFRRKYLFLHHNFKRQCDMNTIAINSNVYRSAVQYANSHNISVSDAVEEAILLLLQKVQTKQRLTETKEFNEALNYVKSIVPTGGKSVPTDENGLDVLVEKKYKL